MIGTLHVKNYRPTYSVTVVQIIVELKLKVII